MPAAGLGQVIADTPAKRSGDGSASAVRRRKAVTRLGQGRHPAPHRWSLGALEDQIERVSNPAAMRRRFVAFPAGRVWPEAALALSRCAACRFELEGAKTPRGLASQLRVEVKVRRSFVTG